MTRSTSIDFMNELWLKEGKALNAIADGVILFGQCPTIYYECICLWNILLMSHVLTQYI